MSQKKHPLLVLILIAISCIILIGNNCTSAQTDVASKKNYQEIIFDQTKLGTEYSRQMVTDAFVDYMLLKNTLAKGNAADAKVTAQTIFAVIKDYSRKMNPDFLPDSRKFKEDMAKLEKKVKASSTLDEARANFSALSDSFIDYIKSYGMYNKTIYLYQCNGKSSYGNGYWLSNSNKDTRNPYGFQDSEDCNTVKESWTFK